jgi:hypothetical protein
LIKPGRPRSDYSVRRRCRQILHSEGHRRKKRWAIFADKWQDELNRKPRLAFVHAKEAYALKGQFSGWSCEERDKRLLKFVSIIQEHVSHGQVFLLNHYDFARFREIVVKHPAMHTAGEKRLFKNPYFLGFLVVLGNELFKHGKHTLNSGTKELIEIVFDEDIDNKKRLELGFSYFVESVRKGNYPQLLDLLVNKQAEFRDDKHFLPLQAADLLAWHVRRHMYELARRRLHDNPVWLKLTEDRIQYGKMSYGAKELIDLLDRMIAPYL